MSYVNLERRTAQPSSRRPLFIRKAISVTLAAFVFYLLLTHFFILFLDNACSPSHDKNSYCLRVFGDGNFSPFMPASACSPAMRRDMITIVLLV